MGKDDSDLLRETHDKVSQIWAAFYGVADTNNRGMYGEFHNLKNDYYRFKRMVFMVFAFVVGTGSLGLGIFKLAEWLR